MAGSESTPVASAPTRKEDAVYDRQIRLWGKEAQEKMAKSKVLYIHVTGLTSEVLKNLVLAGIRASICDGREYPSAVATTPSFFLTQHDRATKRQKYTVADVLKRKIEELNPLLGECDVVNESPSRLTADYLKQFSIVIASRIGISDASRISQDVVASGGKFYLADCFGMYGVSAFDLGAKHTYRPELAKKLLDVTGLKEHYTLEQILQMPIEDATNRFHKTPPPAWIQYRCILEYVKQTDEWPDAANAPKFVSAIRTWIKATSPTLVEHELMTESALLILAKTATAEIAPVCSVLGGVLGNEMIKAISGKGEPANNTLLFDAHAAKCWTFLLKPKV